MIFVARMNEPAIVTEKRQSWLEALEDAENVLDQLEKDPATPQERLRKARRQRATAQDRYRASEIKRALVEMFKGKCAYCESPIRVVTYGHIEHFCPKSQYPLKTFDWGNLLLACDICNNSEHKGVNYPTTATGEPLLINPTDEGDEPSEHLRFFWDPKTLVSAIYGTDEKGRETELVFDLNGSRGRKELIKARSTHLWRLFVILHFAEQGDTEAREILREACSDSEPYCGSVRALICTRLNINEP